MCGTPPYNPSTSMPLAPPDGRFLINTVIDSGVAPITLLMNWNPGTVK